jgi:hypothetical protein
MAVLWNFFYDKLTGGEKKISESAALIARVFDDDCDGQTFFNSVVAHFDNFDGSNLDYKNETFSNDIDFIAQSTLTSLTPSKNSLRIGNRSDSYFYTYRRIEEYMTMAMQSASTQWGKRLETNLKDIRQALLEQMTFTFTTTKGLEPNICIYDRDLLRHMDIRQHLALITEVDKVEKLNTFFTLSKLSFQSSISLDDENLLRWIDILSKVQFTKLYLTDLVSSYIGYKQAFEKFRLDMPAFIYLIGKMHPQKDNKASPFPFFISCLESLELEKNAFFDQFQPIFAVDVKVERYIFQHIAGLFGYLIQREQLFHKYFTLYARNTTDTNLWDMFLCLIVKIDLKGIDPKQFSSIIAERISTTSVDIFLRYMGSALKCSAEIKDESRPNFMKLLEIIFDAFIEKKLRDDQYSYRLSEMQLEALLKMGRQVSSTPLLEQPSYLLIIQHILFKMNIHGSNLIDKLNRLFQNLNEFDENLCESNDPAQIVRDEWLKDYVLPIPQVWQQLTASAYRKLCDNHRNNRWTIYIWSRIVYLGLVKANYDNPNEILLKMNEWMNDIKHNVYKADDALTIIFVINLFETIIFKYTKSVLSLPNIKSIIEFIVHAQQEQLYPINTNKVDDFIQNGKQTIQEILLLKGEPN